MQLYHSSAKTLKIISQNTAYDKKCPQLFRKKIETSLLKPVDPACLALFVQCLLYYNVHRVYGSPYTKPRACVVTFGSSKITRALLQ